MPHDSFRSDVKRPDQATVIRQLQALCLEELSIHVGSPDDDLFATGVLDSMTLVQLILHLEERFGLALPMEQLETESFRSLAAIAELLLSKRIPDPVSTVA